MMTTFYKIGILPYGKFVEPVEVERFTASTVWVRGRQHRRTTSWEKYFTTENDAWDHLVSNAMASLESCKRSVAYQEEKLDEILRARAE